MFRSSGFNDDASGLLVGSSSLARRNLLLCSTAFQLLTKCFPLRGTWLAHVSTAINA